MEDKIIVNVRWRDGYLECFECSQVRQGGHILWMRLTNGQNRTIPLVGNVRWFSTDPESHAEHSAMELAGEGISEWRGRRNDS